tara:strand:+ start:241 stop:480 length:240 start_codon:yes stop_codon:yes gene_type:complete
LLDSGMPQIGKILIVSGISLFSLGCVFFFLGDKIKWFGDMPLDISYKNDSTHFFAPIGSMILLSIILTVIANIFLRLFK